MAASIDVRDLGKEIRRKRGTRSLKDIEGETGVSASTLSRIERGSHQPDLATVTRLAEWLSVTIRTAGNEEGEIRTTEDLKRAVEVYLRANKRLSEEAARSVAEALPAIVEYEVQRQKRERSGKESP
jgi:transcriptional regulator with XRE-family HTH domain